MADLPADHQCPAIDELKRVRDELAAVREELAALKKRKHRPRSERMRPIKDELRDGAPPTKARREPRSKTHEDVPAETTRRRVTGPQRQRCRCGCTEVTDIRQHESTVFESIPARVVRRTFIDETIRFACGHEVTSAVPAKVVEGGDYGPGLVADVVVDKIEDVIPIYRQAKRWRRLGLPISRSTLNDLFHQAAQALRPLHARMVTMVAAAKLVKADETTFRVLAAQKCRTAWMWVFLNATVIVYCFRASRSGETPRQVLGKSDGTKTLLVDGHTGYNKVATMDGWRRAGCQAHGRRKFFDAGGAEAQVALGFFREMYRVEHEAAQLGIAGTPAHLLMRLERTLPIFRKFHRWLVDQRPRHHPRGELSKAIRYALNNRKTWMRCFRDASVPLDNNASEAALRVVALLRKVALFTGNDICGENHAILLTLVATCKLHGVNPRDYLADVLLRVQTHPHSRLDELLPHNWAHTGATRKQDHAHAA